jgi:hypothetical protein
VAWPIGHEWKKENNVDTERRRQRGEACGEIMREVNKIAVWKYLFQETIALDNSRSEAGASCIVESFSTSPCMFACRMPWSSPWPLAVLQVVLPHAGSSIRFLENPPLPQFGPQILDQVFEGAWRGGIAEVESVDACFVDSLLQDVCNGCWASDCTRVCS